MKYTKNTPRLAVKFINADTEEVLFEVHDRSWMNVGELLSDFYVDNLMKTELKNKKLPKNLLVLVVSEFKLE
jgi:hypothetical protein